MAALEISIVYEPGNYQISTTCSGCKIKSFKKGPTPSAVSLHSISVTTSIFTFVVQSIGVLLHQILNMVGTSKLQLWTQTKGSNSFLTVQKFDHLDKLNLFILFFLTYTLTAFFELDHNLRVWHVELVAFDMLGIFSNERDKRGWVLTKAVYAE
jgi:hypothetical protein